MLHLVIRVQWHPSFVLLLQRLHSFQHLSLYCSTLSSSDPRCPPIDSCCTFDTVSRQSSISRVHPSLCALHIVVLHIFHRESNFIVMFFFTRPPHTSGLAIVPMFVAVAWNVIRNISVLLSKWCLCIRGKVSHFVHCFVGYPKFVFSCDVVEFVGELWNIRHQH